MKRLLIALTALVLFSLPIPGAKAAEPSYTGAIRISAYVESTGVTTYPTASGLYKVGADYFSYAPVVQGAFTCPDETGGAYPRRCRYAGSNGFILVASGGGGRTFYPQLRVCNDTQATCFLENGSTIESTVEISSVATVRPPTGTLLCQSGRGTNNVTNSEGVGCGKSATAVGYPDNCSSECLILPWNSFSTTAPATNADVGGPVWTPKPDGTVELVGFVKRVQPMAPQPDQLIYQSIWHWQASCGCQIMTGGEFVD